jgi:hypothetical protein
MQLLRSSIIPCLFAAGVFAGAASVSLAADPTVDQIKSRSEIWPLQVKVSELLDYGAIKIPAGTEVDFCGFEGSDLAFVYRNQRFRLEPELTDLAARAGRIASGEAARAGWHGRIAEYLIRKGQVVTASGFAPVTAAQIPADAIVVIYIGSSGCSFCAAAVPFMDQEIDLLAQRHPGRVCRVYSTADNDSPAARAYARQLGAGWIVAPLGDQYLWSGLPQFIPAAAQAVNYPALALVTPQGRYLFAGMRQEIHTDAAAAVLLKLEEILASPDGKVAMSQ